MEQVRIDRWLWAARFFKTRSLAAAAVEGGKVQVNGSRVKRSKLIGIGDELRIRQPPFEQVVVIRSLSERRGPAKEAVTLYQETTQSVEAREHLRLQLALQPSPGYRGKGRPTKQDRRVLERFKKGRGR